MTPTISVIASAYNEHKLLKKCLQSIRGRSFRDDALIVVDNAIDVRVTFLTLCGKRERCYRNSRCSSL